MLQYAYKYDNKNQLSEANRGIAHYRLSKNQSAMEDLNQAAELAPNNENVYVNRAMVKMGMGKYEDANKDLDIALTLQPTNFEAMFNKGISFLSLNSFAAAIISFDSAIKTDPAYTDTFYYRGLAKQKNKDIHGACEDFKKAATAGNMDAQAALKENCQ